MNRSEMLRLFSMILREKQADWCVVRLAWIRSSRRAVQAVLRVAFDQLQPIGFVRKFVGGPVYSHKQVLERSRIPEILQCLRFDQAMLESWRISDNSRFDQITSLAGKIAGAQRPVAGENARSGECRKNASRIHVTQHPWILVIGLDAVARPKNVAGVADILEDDCDQHRCADEQSDATSCVSDFPQGAICCSIHCVDPLPHRMTADAPCKAHVQETSVGDLCLSDIESRQ